MLKAPYHSKLVLWQAKIQLLNYPDHDDSEYSCHISGYWEGSWLMLCVLIDEELHFEKFHMPFGCMLILSDGVIYGVF